MGNIAPRHILRTVQLLFWIALLVTLAAALMPARTAPHLFPWDKAEHFTAFYMLTLLAVAAFPRRSVFVLAVLLSLAGALIEVLQLLPIVKRDGDIRDWLADTVAIAAALMPLALARWRAWLNRAALGRAVK